ncbi:ASCH domain-containing protein [Atlantibacter sp.]|uniref:ASCH domain-containing protein n=1 Tax=Atlantibacter sp. TaxID=1903473 RepID=UPI0028AF28DD|nr:ASCH domain-containing protein [Atlantibacter sp.]
MTTALHSLQQRYPQAAIWGFGDSPQMADELAALVIQGRKRASCGALVSYLKEPILPGSYNIILNGRDEPVCVIRTTVLRVVRYGDVTAELASREGEGDLSLAYWQASHQAFFEREGTWSPEMELVFEEFELVDVV